MDVADKPHLVRLVETIRYLENVYISEVDYKSSIPPIYCANTFVFVGQNIPLVNLPVVLVFQPRVLADGVGIDLYASIVAENMRSPLSTRLPRNLISRIVFQYLLP